MAPFSKPEAVLKQAEGLISVGQTHAALQSLNEMFSSKRFRSTPVTSLEPIMLRFIELCVDLRKGRFAKEGLMQYKNITQNTSVASIELVIQTFLQLASEKVHQAQVKADKAVELLDVDDLEASETPEDILLSAVSGDQSKDRTDRALVTPWLKFLWESYRSALETLKNNARLEVIYQQIALQAFKFCLSHGRKVEFRRLCETLRLHLANVAKYSHQTHSVNLSDPDTLQRFLDTRFAQLNTSVELELWQEAFRSIEDIHSLLTMSKRPPKAAMMVNYYEKLYKIFMTSGSILYHAAAWSKYYAIVRTTGSKSDEELAHFAGMVLLSALSVPNSAELIEDGDETKGKHARLTTLLGLSKTPSRTNLLAEALARNVLKLSPAPIQRLYHILEVDFDPLELCAKVAPILQSLSQEERYLPYLAHLRRVVLSRLLSQLAQAYTSMSIRHLLSLVAPLNSNLPDEHPSRFDQENIEAFIMSTARRGEILVRINHSEGSLTFVDDAFVSKRDGTLGTPLQPSPGTLVRTRLTNIAQALQVALHVISPDDSSQMKLKAAFDSERAERAALQLRRSIVARRRELLAELTARRQSEERSQQAEITRKAQEEAQRRKKDDALREARERAKNEMDKKRREESERILSSLKDKGISANLEEMDTDDLLKLQIQQMDREKKELNERMRIIAKRIDHFERALRKAELPLLADDYERQQQDDRVAFEVSRQQALEAAQQAHSEQLTTKTRLARMQSEYKKFIGSLERKRNDDHSKRLQEAAVQAYEEKSARRTKVLHERAEEDAARQEAERVARETAEREAQEKAEREAREAQEQAEREREEQAEERRRQEEADRLAETRRRREEERAAAEKTARLQQQRQAEAERRRLDRERERLVPARAPSSSNTGGPSEWRRQPTSQTESSPAPRSSPAGASTTSGRYVPPSQRGDGTNPSGGRYVPPSQRAADASGPTRTPWRPAGPERAANSTGRNSPAPASSQLPPRSSTPAAVDEEGFQTVGKSTKPSTGVYRPPGRR